MNKKDFWILMVCNFVNLGLLIECLCGVPTAFEFMCGSTIISLIIHICILKDYIRVSHFVKKDYTR